MEVKMGMTYSEYASFHPISRKDFIKQFSECQCKYCGEPLTDGYFCKTCFKNEEMEYVKHDEKVRELEEISSSERLNK